MTAEQRIAVWAASTAWLAFLYRVPYPWRFPESILRMQRNVAVALGKPWLGQRAGAPPSDPLFVCDDPTPAGGWEPGPKGTGR